MCVTESVFIESEEVAQLSQREMSLHILLFVHHTAAEGFLVGLSLEDLLLNRSCL